MTVSTTIFVTVGTQGPFDRLVGAVDDWARRRGEPGVFAQIGRGGAPPSHIRWAETQTPAEFLDHVRSARAIVAHAGMGTIITALEHGKPILLLPRRAALGEQRNDHQLATARRFQALGKARVAYEAEDIPSELDEILSSAADNGGVSPPSPALLNAIAAFIHGEPPITPARDRA